MTIVPACRGGRGLERLDLAPRAAEADLAGVDAEVGQRQVSTGFFFAAMIPLNDG